MSYNPTHTFSAADGGKTLSTLLNNAYSDVATYTDKKLGNSVSVLDYGADPTGVALSTTAFSVAHDVAVAAGSYLYIPSGDYRLGAIAKTTTCPWIGTDAALVRLILDEGPFGTTQGPWLRWSGSRGTEYPLTVNATALQYQVTVSGANATALVAAGAGPGSVILVASEVEFEPSFRVGEKEGQSVEIDSINTGTGVITLREALVRDFATANSSFVSLMNLLERPTFGGITLFNEVQDSNRVIQLTYEYCRNLDIEYVTRYPDSEACQIASCYGGHVKGDIAYMQNDNPGIQYGYGLAIGAASSHISAEIRAVQCRHAFTTLGSTQSAGHVSGLDYGTPNDLRVTGQAYQCTSDAWDTHPGGDNILIYDVTAIGCKSAGIQLRTRNSHVRGALIDACPDGVRVDITSGKWSIQGVKVSRTHRNSTNPDYSNTGSGVRIENSGDEGIIADCIFEDIWTNVVRWGGGVPANTAVHNGLVFKGNIVRRWNLGNVGASDAAIFQANGASVNDVKAYGNTFYHTTANDRVWNGTIWGGACEHGQDNHHICPVGVTPQGINNLVRCQSYTLNGQRVWRRQVLTFNATQTIDTMLSNWYELTLTNNVTSVTFSVPSGMFFHEFELLLIQDGTGGWTFNFPATVRWGTSLGGNPPGSMQGVDTGNTAGTREWFKFRYDGSTWRCIDYEKYAT